ncbi:MAG TPA: hypothetical protein VJ488_01810, partial [Dehalococcoidia bacterium]|nr:hypothetical protein [Dehalococcoidia bacterium]
MLDRIKMTAANLQLQKNFDFHMHQVPEVVTYCQRCLNTQRWDGSILLMIVDASFTSIGLNYFHSVVPGVEKFRKELVETRIISSLADLSASDCQILEAVWKNKRSWHAAREIASFLTKTGRKTVLSERQSFLSWAVNSSLVNWKLDPIGKIKGVGINIYQYLRMMGGIDTVMPDKIVKRVINGILAEAGEPLPAD